VDFACRNQCSTRPPVRNWAFPSFAFVRRVFSSHPPPAPGVLNALQISSSEVAQHIGFTPPAKTHSRDPANRPCCMPSIFPPIAAPPLQNCSCGLKTTVGPGTSSRPHARACLPCSPNDVKMRAPAKAELETEHRGSALHCRSQKKNFVVPCCALNKADATSFLRSELRPHGPKWVFFKPARTWRMPSIESARNCANDKDRAPGRQ